MAAWSRKFPSSGAERCVDGPFHARWGAPAQIKLAKLQSWTEHTDPGVQHYSGAAVYTQEFDLGAVPTGGRVLLDLGGVAVVAAARLNGRDLGVAWKPRMPSTRRRRSGPAATRLRSGGQSLGQPPDRRCGAAGSRAEDMVTWNPYRPGDPLLPPGCSGRWSCVSLLHSRPPTHSRRRLPAPPSSTLLRFSPTMLSPASFLASSWRTRPSSLPPSGRRTALRSPTLSDRPAALRPHLGPAGAGRTPARGHARRRASPLHGPQ